MIDWVRRATVPALLLTLSMVAAGCGGDEVQQPERQRTVTLVTDSSWEIPDELYAAFERQTDLKLEHRKVGDNPAELVKALAASPGTQQGDVVAGLDTSTVSSVLAADVLIPYTSPEGNKGQQRFSVDRQQRLSAVDRLTVCVNVDESWFREQDMTPPEQAADLTDPAYRDLLAVPHPESSLHGMSFLLGSIASEGKDGWLPFWKQLKANGVQVLPTVDDVREEYTAVGVEGKRPLVVASATLPAQLPEDAEAETSVLPDTCHEQVRYAGVLANASSTQRAGKLLDFLLTQQFQQEAPEAFGTYPAREGVELPNGWAETAELPEEASTLPARAADAGRKEALPRWRHAMGE